MASVTVAPQIQDRIEVLNRPAATIGCLVITDGAALLLSVAVSLIIKALTQGPFGLDGYLRLWPFLFVFLLVYACVGLYSIVALSPPEELRRATISSVVLFLLLGASTVSFRGARHQFTWTLFLAIAIGLIALPLSRACARQLFASKPWWGYPAVVFGFGKSSERIVRAMLDDPWMSLKPVAVVGSGSHGNTVDEVPVLYDFEQAAQLIPKGRRAYAVFAGQDLPCADLNEIVERYRRSFSNILFIPDLAGLSSLWVASKNIGGMLGLEVCQTKNHDRMKRALDLSLAFLFGIFAGPLCLLFSALIRLDGGPALFSQSRIGLDGKPFHAWKFRTMVTNSGEMLNAHLAAHPDARHEWDRSHKLKNDPRVTRFGRILRKTSLDELPQVWNVLKGEMSFVGPRPIVESEIRHYGKRYDLYKRVRGGITGLWQVSGRSDTSYEERVALDSFYSRNWSVWLDLCILFRTFSVVLFGKGAY